MYVVEDAPRERMCEAEIERKLAGYRKQDLKAGRSWKKREELSARDVLHMSTEQRHVCFLCGEVMNLRNRNKDPCNWSVDRLDNSLPHIKGNCKLSHISCNVGKCDVL